MLLALAFLLIGLVLGAALAYLYLRPRLQTQSDPLASLNDITQHVLTLAKEKLGEHTTLATQQLDSKGQVITANLGELKTQLGENLAKVSARLEQLEKDRATQYSALGQQLQQTAQQLTTLNTATGSLTSALSNSRVRGQWGERMAEDVLRCAGLKEGVQYRKQAALRGDEGARPRPDFTFTLPGGRVIHMDVKFPMDSYTAYQQNPEEASKTAFLKAARACVTEAAKRNYPHAVTTQGEASLEYLLVFIPNEQVYAFLFEHDANLLTDALKQNVILCSPTTLLAVLALVRQAEQTFRLHEDTIALKRDLDTFHKQWKNFIEAHDDVAKAFESVQTRFTKLLGTRTNVLEKAFDKLLPDPTATAANPLLTHLQPEETLN